MVIARARYTRVHQLDIYLGSIRVDDDVGVRKPSVGFS